MSLLDLSLLDFGPGCRAGVVGERGFVPATPLVSVSWLVGGVGLLFEMWIVDASIIRRPVP